MSGPVDSTTSTAITDFLVEARHIDEAFDAVLEQRLDETGHALGAFARVGDQRRHPALGENALHALDDVDFRQTHRGARRRYAPDLVRDPVVSFVDRTFLVWALGGLAAAFALGYAIGGTLKAALTGLLWGGGVRMLVVPGSMRVRFQAEKEGLSDVFTAAGAEWRSAGCSMCLGMNPDQLAPGERSASTSNRNFEGRQGKGGRTHLVSPLVAAATAVRGTLSSPEDLD